MWPVIQRSVVKSTSIQLFTGCDADFTLTSPPVFFKKRRLRSPPGESVATDSLLQLFSIVIKRKSFFLFPHDDGETVYQPINPRYKLA